MPPNPPHTFDTLYTHLTTHHGHPLLHPPGKTPHTPSHTITTLALHPTLESLLHILNADLPSAHFLLRHMQSPPAYAAMFVHGLLHRVEGDYRNAEAWYGDVADSEVFKAVWGEAEGGLGGAKAFIGRVEGLRKEGVGDGGVLEAESRREFEALAGWCKGVFGTGRWEDATQVWVEPSEEIRRVAAKQVVGGEGWRQF